MLERKVIEYINNNGKLLPSEAIEPSLEGLQIFDTPIFGYSLANDDMYDQFKEKYEITYGNFNPPKNWLPEAKTVISIFFPYSEKVKKSNGINSKLPSNEWLHGRIEGQNIIAKCTQMVVNYLNEQGYNGVAPCLDERFSATIGTWLDTDEKISNKDFYSNWSERHVAFVSGLGTFGLSKGIITRKGMAGRFTSIITDYEHKATERKYEGVYEYCTMCGKCISMCPVKAITLETGKNHTKCSRFVDYTEVRYKPRYGCGKCQVSVPCSSRIPRDADEF